jgi:hypothetical protein
MSRKVLLASLLAMSAGLAAGGAAASDVRWAVNINAPLGPGVVLGTVLSNAPLYRPAHVVYRPAPVYRPVPVVYQPVYVPYRAVKQRYRHCDHHRHRGHHHDDDD